MMAAIEYLFRSGWVAAIALGVLWFGTVAVCTRSREPLVLFSSLLANALSGTFLLLAIGAALKDMDVTWVAALMAGSLVAHAADLWQRLAVRRRD